MNVHIYKKIIIIENKVLQSHLLLFVYYEQHNHWFMLLKMVSNNILYKV